VAAAAAAQNRKGLTEYSVEMQWIHYNTERCRQRLDIRTGHESQEVMRSRDRK